MLFLSSFLLKVDKLFVVQISSCKGIKSINLTMMIKKETSLQNLFFNKPETSWKRDFQESLSESDW